MDASELADLLRETGRKHHAAFIEADGVDPEWALWYSSYLQGQLWDRLGRIPTRGELIYLLVGCDREFRASDLPRADWPSFYAERFLAHFGDE